jgi:tryptophan-rich sensory protein
MSQKQMSRRFIDTAAAVGFVLACFIVTGAAQLLFNTQAGDWYGALRKPAFTPPNWVFAPVWTVLYVCMGLAAWFVWRWRSATRVALPLVLFAAQLLLNAAWPVLFFDLHRIDVAFAEILFLLAAVTLTVWHFFRVSRPAGWLMAPYIAWVAFATILNFSIWRLNL